MDTQEKGWLLSPPIIFTIILIEGFVTIAVEMLTIRQLITVVGNSVIITSLIIGIFLLFLALGYYQGGRYTKNYARILKTNFCISALLLGIGLSYLFIQLFFYKLEILSLNGLITLTIYLLIITAPLVFCLGQTVPITTNLFRSTHHIGAISGKALALSTVGSFLGSILSTLVLMNFLGVAWTIFINVALLLVLILLLSDFAKDKLLLFLMLVALIFIWGINISLENRLFVKTNNYGDYQILRNVIYNSRIGSLLNINNAPSSFLDLNNRGFEYIEYIKQVLFHQLKLSNKNILVLGAGGFSLSAESNFGNRFTYVDIDGELPAITSQGFNNRVNGQFIHDDARRFLATTKQQFDVIVSDVYSARYTIPFHLITMQYFQAVKRRLATNGIAVFNIIADPMLRDNYSRRVDNTIRAVFTNCLSVPIPYTNTGANLIYICSMPENKDKTIYTDNLNPAMIDIYTLTRKK